VYVVVVFKQYASIITLVTLLKFALLDFPRAHPFIITNVATTLLFIEFFTHEYINGYTYIGNKAISLNESVTYILSVTWTLVICLKCMPTVLRHR